MSVSCRVQPLSPVLTPILLSLPVATPRASTLKPKESRSDVNLQSLPQSGLVRASLARKDKLLSSEEEKSLSNFKAWPGWEETQYVCPFCQLNVSPPVLTPAFPPIQCYLISYGSNMFSSFPRSHLFWAELCSPNSRVEAPSPQNMPLFGDRASQEAIKLERSRYAGF